MILKILRDSVQTSEAWDVLPDVRLLKKAGAHAWHAAALTAQPSTMTIDVSVPNIHNVGLGEIDLLFFTAAKRSEISANFKLIIAALKKM
jgi:hypothetical protein